MTDDRGRYGGVAIFYHWVMVVLVVTAGTLGLLNDSWPRATRARWINVHALVGLTVLAVLILRLIWRASHRPPPLPQEAGEFSRRLSTPVHLLLYLLLLAVPVFGIVTFVWHGRTFHFGLFNLHLHVRRSRTIARLSEEIHGYLAYALFGLVGLHVLAAIWHHFVRRDRILARMWPRLRNIQGEAE